MPISWGRCVSKIILLSRDACRPSEGPATRRIRDHTTISGIHANMIVITENNQIPRYGRAGLYITRIRQSSFEQRNVDCSIPYFRETDDVKKLLNIRDTLFSIWRPLQAPRTTFGPIEKGPVVFRSRDDRHLQLLRLRLGAGSQRGCRGRQNIHCGCSSMGTHRAGRSRRACRSRDGDDEASLHAPRQAWHQTVTQPPAGKRRQPLHRIEL